MRKFFLLSFLIIFLGLNLNAQTVSTSVGSLPSVGGNLEVPINITGYSSVIHPTFMITMYLEYDLSVLNYVNATNSAHPWLTVTQMSSHRLRIAISDPASTSSFSVSDGTVVKLNFTFNGGNTNLTFPTTGIEPCTYMDENYDEFNIAVTNNQILGGYVSNTISSGTWGTSGNWSLGVVPNAFHNVTVNGSLVTIADNATSNDLVINSGKALTVNSGKTLSVSGTFQINSDATGTGSFINNGTYSGTATVQRYINNNNSWHFLSSPVNNQAIKPNFAPASVATNFDFYKWDQSVSMTAGNLPWINIRDISGAYAAGFDNFTNGHGYLVAYSSGYGTADHVFSGTLNTAAQVMSVSNSVNTFNLLGNPYPSAIDWTLCGSADRTTYLGSANPSIWIWNQSASNYGVYNGSGTNGVTNIIAPHQGFFVQAAATGSFTIPTAAKVHGSQSFLKTTIADLLRLKVSSTANTFSDEIIVNFDANATVDQGAAKWFSMVAAAPSLYSVKNGINLSINTLGTITNNLVVPVGFKAGVNGTYTINASDLNTFTNSTYIYLKDLKTNTIQDLNQNANYTFVGVTSDNAARFELIFTLTPLSIATNQIVNTTNIYSYDNTVFVNSTDNVKQISIYNTIGQSIYSVDKPTGLFQYNLNGNNTGYYIVKVITDKNVSSEKVFVK